MLWLSALVVRTSSRVTSLAFLLSYPEERWVLSCVGVVWPPLGIFFGFCHPVEKTRSSQCFNFCLCFMFILSSYGERGCYLLDPLSNQLLSI